MCVSCGCGTPEDKHGDERNITLSELQGAAEAAKVDIAQVVANIQKGVEAGGASGSSSGSVGR